MATAELDALATPSAVLEGNTALTEGGSLTAIAPFILGKANLILDMHHSRPRPWQNEGMALGFVATRTLEAAMIFAGVASLLSLVALQKAGASGADATSLTTVGQALVAFYNAVFLVGQSLMPVANALLLGTLMYRSGLVPRVIPLFGLIGAPLQFTAVILTMFGVIERTSTATGILVIPDFIWELSLGIYLVVKGFKPCPITDAMLAADTPPAYRDVVVA